MSGKAKRRRERERRDSRPELTAEELELSRRRAEAVFKRCRYVLMGRDEALLEIREPALAFAHNHVVWLRGWLREGLAGRGVALPEGVDPIVVAAAMIEGRVSPDTPSIVRV